MPRPKLYQTDEERKEAVRKRNAAHYIKNREAIKARMRERRIKVKLEKSKGQSNLPAVNNHIVPTQQLHTPDPSPVKNDNSPVSSVPAPPWAGKYRRKSKFVHLETESPEPMPMKGNIPRPALPTPPPPPPPPMPPVLVSRVENHNNSNLPSARPTLQPSPVPEQRDKHHKDSDEGSSAVNGDGHVCASGFGSDSEPESMDLDQGDFNFATNASPTQATMGLTEVRSKIDTLRECFEKNLLSSLDERKWVDNIYRDCITSYATGGTSHSIHTIHSWNLQVLDIYHTSKRLIGHVRLLDEDEMDWLEEFMERVGKTSDMLWDINFYV
ncbi:hypothetical protein D9758_014685 [Tetrapyrgos nigripes]|uniref:Uncharacterized protein n=1 Tax=Tetrapyrgos nigripes TaxID=182062 RepID=A0A8H5CL10_9AGAR|nr:hypothetical protein D9758_014685 [Tetrapyrgos nigripes]